MTSDMKEWKCPVSWNKSETETTVACRQSTTRYYSSSNKENHKNSQQWYLTASPVSKERTFRKKVRRVSAKQLCTVPFVN